MKRHLVRAVLLAAFITALAGQAQDASTPVRHAPISIRGNASFTAYNGVVRGTGTAEDPFVIEGWLFDGEESGIDVANTNAFFVIRDCRFDRTSKYDPISFTKVSNGRIERCTVEGSTGRCVNFDESSDCTIAQCDLTNTAEFAVIALWSCSRITVTENTLRSAPRWTSWCGIVLWGTEASLLTRNVIASCGNAVALNRYVDGATDAIGNTLAYNSLSESESADISIEEASVRNLFFCNNLASVASRAPSGANTWDNGVEGNYWGHGILDRNGDGIGDVSYSLENGDVDRHPLARPWRDTVVLAGVKSSSAEEWVTLRNWARSEVNLEGWGLEIVAAATGKTSASFSFPAGCVVPPNGTLIVHSAPALDGRTIDRLGTATAVLWGEWQTVSRPQTAHRGEERHSSEGGMLRLLDSRGQAVDEIECEWNIGS